MYKHTMKIKVKKDHFPPLYIDIIIQFMPFQQVFEKYLILLFTHEKKQFFNEIFFLKHFPPRIRGLNEQINALLGIKKLSFAYCTHCHDDSTLDYVVHCTYRHKVQI